MGDVLSLVQMKWDDLCRQPAINRFHFSEETGRIINQKGSAYSAQPINKHGKWMKGKKEIVLVPSVPEFVLQIALSACQQRRPTKASIVKQTMDTYTGFNKEDLEALLGIAINGIVVDQSQVGKESIRPPALASPVRISDVSITFPHGIRAQHPPDTVHQQHLDPQHQLGRTRWPAGLRVRSSWRTLGRRMASKARPSELDLKLSAAIKSYKRIIIVVGAGISVAAGSKYSSPLTPLV